MKRVFYTLTLAALLVAAPLSAQALQIAPTGWEDKYGLYSLFIDAGAAPKMLNTLKSPLYDGKSAEFTFIGGMSDDPSIFAGFSSNDPLGTKRTITLDDLLFRVNGGPQYSIDIDGEGSDNHDIRRIDWFELGADYLYKVDGYEVMLGKGTFIFGFEDASMGDDHDFDDMFFAVNIKSPVVPIPGAVWLMGSGLAGLCALRRKIRA